MVRKVFAARRIIILYNTKNLICFCDKLGTEEFSIFFNIGFVKSLIVGCHHTTPGLGGPSHSNVSHAKTILKANRLLQEGFKLLHNILASYQVKVTVNTLSIKLVGANMFSQGRPLI